jgi:hypothetical protein
MVVRTKQGQQGRVRGRRTGAQVGSGSTPGAPSSGVGGFVNDGDSLTFSIAKMPYPKQLSNLTGLGAINLGVAGQQLSGMDMDYATHTAPSFNSTTANTLVLTGGINDIISGGGTQSSIDTSIRSYVAKAKATGFKVYITTMTPVTVGTNSFTSGMETIRQAVNTDRVTNWAQYADGLIDLAANASLSDSTNTAQYLDNIHWTNASNNVVADLVRAGVGLSPYTPAPRATATTLDPSNKAASVTLSNGNLTAVGGGATNTVQVRSVASIRPRDKVYFEVVLDNAGNGNSGFGFGVTEYNAATTDNFLGAHMFDVCLLIGLSGVVYHNSAGTGEALSTAVTTSGSRYGVAVDRVNNKWWARLNGGSWNNNGSADPTTNVGGFDLAWTYADDLFAALMIPSESMTVNFGATAFTDTKPTGYNIT